MKIIILDRDGVINFDSADYIKSAAEWIPIPGSLEAIHLLTDHGYKIYIATNQAGIGRGILTLEALDGIHSKMTGLIEDQGGHVQGIFFCPHHPDELCECRKPGIGLLTRIADDSSANLWNQPFVGDSITDIMAASAMGCQPILVKTGKTRRYCRSKEKY